MTNEQTTEIANHRESEFGEIRDIDGCCFMSALGMAEWKDAQLKQLLSEHIEHATGQRFEAFMDLYRELFEQKRPIKTSDNS